MKTTLRAEISGVSNVEHFEVFETKYRLYHNIYGMIEVHKFNEILNRYIVSANPPKTVQKIIKDHIKEYVFINN